MKVTIEIDLPKGVTKAEAEGAVKRAFDPDWIASWWHISDVHSAWTIDLVLLDFWEHNLLG